MSDSEGYDALGQAEVEAADKRRRNSWVSRMRWPLMIAGPLVIIAVTAFFILTGGKTQATENAYVQVAKAPVSASIAGRVIEVLVKENQVVKKGDPLFRLDPRDLSVALEESNARLSQAQSQVMALKADYAQARARVAQVQEVIAYSQRDADRQKALFDAGVGARDAYDKAVHTVQNARADLAAAQQAQNAALAHLSGQPNQQVDQNPLVLAARADVERVQLNQSYGVVTALTDGIVTRVDQLQPGAYVNTAQTLFWLITGEPWVEANFKEDQLEKMKVGQPATIVVDAYKGETLTGRVASFSPGTGQVFSALPAQNATGNWVKVTQRLPVRIVFDKTPPAMAGRGGLSAHVKVDITGAGTETTQPQTKG